MSIKQRVLEKLEVLSAAGDLPDELAVVLGRVEYSQMMQESDVEPNQQIAGLPVIRKNAIDYFAVEVQTKD